MQALDCTTSAAKNHATYFARFLCSASASASAALELERAEEEEATVDWAAARWGLVLVVPCRTNAINAPAVPVSRAAQARTGLGSGRSFAVVVCSVRLVTDANVPDDGAIWCVANSTANLAPAVALHRTHTRRSPDRTHSQDTRHTHTRRLRHSRQDP